MREHRNTSPACDGNLNFDFSAEEQRGLCWREKVICDACCYTSQKFNLYTEVKRHGPGRKAATANVGLNIALTQAPIGSTCVRKICLSSCIPAPSRSGLNKCASKVCKDIQRINESDMKSRRAELKKINQLRGKPENEIPVQSDGIYNNNLYSGVGKTPFQPATQCSYVVAENVTPKKQIIALENVNKLCSKYGFHSKDDDHCKILSGDCTSNIPIEKNIGDEKEWAKRCFQDLKSDDLEINILTTDPDTSAYRAAEELRLSGITKTKPEHQIDTRHLSANHRKTLKRKAAVEQMMPDGRKTYRKKLQDRFALDVSARCTAEFESVHRGVHGDFKQLNSRISKAVEAMKMCYVGDHSLCNIQSAVCKGLENDNWIVKSTFLRRNFKLKLDSPKYMKTFEECIEYRLGQKMLEKTKYNTNTQKVESVNKVIRRSLPKSITFPRCFPGRAHSAIFASNNGPGESIVKLCEETGCPIPSNSKVAAALLTAQKESDKGKERAKSMKRKKTRKFTAKRKFKIHENQQEIVNYRKGMLLRDAAQKRRTQSKVNQFIRYGDTYSVRIHRLATRRKNQKRQDGECSNEHTLAARQ